MRENPTKDWETPRTANNSFQTFILSLALLLRKQLRSQLGDYSKQCLCYALHGCHVRGTALGYLVTKSTINYINQYSHADLSNGPKDPCQLFRTVNTTDIHHHKQVASKNTPLIEMMYVCSGMGEGCGNALCLEMFQFSAAPTDMPGPCSSYLRLSGTWLLWRKGVSGRPQAAAVSLACVMENNPQNTHTNKLYYRRVAMLS